MSLNGKNEARQTARELFEYDFEAIYSAACLAAQQTAQMMSHSGEVRVRVEENWTNLNHGLWHGKSLEELKETQPKLYRQWHENPESVCPPGGETIEEVRKRVAVSLKKIRKKYKSGTVAIVAPEPLYSIIRSELEDSAIEELPHLQPSHVRWEPMEIPAKAML